MTTEEFDVLDELYFVISFDQLKQETGLEEDALRKILARLLENDWIECYGDQKEPIPERQLDFQESYKFYSYLATKKGLIAHTKG